MKINKWRRKRKAKRRPPAVCFNSCVWCILLDGWMLMGTRQTGSGSAFWCCGNFPQFFKQILFLFFYLVQFLFSIWLFRNCLLKKEKGRKEDEAMRSRSAWLPPPRKWGKQSECKQTDYSCHTLTWGDAHQHMWTGRRRKTVAETKIKMRGGERKQRWGNMPEPDAQTHTRATAPRDVQFNQIPSTNKQVHRQGGFLRLSTRSFARPVIPASADLHSFILVLKSHNGTQ